MLRRLNVLGRPDLGRYAHLAQPSAEPGDALRAVFLGVSTVLLRAHGHAVMTDGFFSRPSATRVLTRRIGPDHRTVARAMRRLAVRSLGLVLPLHAHYDHAMDAPVVAALTGATVAGSPSTANVARGYGLPEHQIRTVRGGDVLTHGPFTVTVLPAEHSPQPLATGSIDQPLVPPARATSYRMGECFAVLVECDGWSVLVNGSAGAVPGALAGCSADTVYFGIPTLGRLGLEHRDMLWREVVEAAGAQRVIPVHWDDFWRPLDRPLVPLRRFADDLDVTMPYLVSRCAEAGIELAMPVAWRLTDPVAGLVRR